MSQFTVATYASVQAGSGWLEIHGCKVPFSEDQVTKFKHVQHELLLAQPSGDRLPTVTNVAAYVGAHLAVTPEISSFNIANSARARVEVQEPSQYGKECRAICEQVRSIALYKMGKVGLEELAGFTPEQLSAIEGSTGNGSGAKGLRVACGVLALFGAAVMGYLVYRVWPAKSIHQ